MQDCADIITKPLHLLLPHRRLEFHPPDTQLALLARQDDTRLASQGAFARRFVHRTNPVWIPSGYMGRRSLHGVELLVVIFVVFGLVQSSTGYKNSMSIVWWLILSTGVGALCPLNSTITSK